MYLEKLERLKIYNKGSSFYAPSKPKGPKANKHDLIED